MNGCQYCCISFGAHSTIIVQMAKKKRTQTCKMSAEQTCHINHQPIYVFVTVTHCETKRRNARNIPNCSYAVRYGFVCRFFPLPVCCALRLRADSGLIFVMKLCEVFMRTLSAHNTLHIHYIYTR